MFLIVLIVSVFGLLSVIAAMTMAAGYGIGLILLAGLIRNARQEISRGTLARLLLAIAVDHFLSAVIALSLAILMVTVPEVRDFFPLIHGPKLVDETLLSSLSLILACFSILWTAVGTLLVLIRDPLTLRGSVQRELDWEPWLTTMVVVGYSLQIPSAFLFLAVCAPFLWQVDRLARMKRQGNLIWTLALAVRRGLPVGREVRTLSEGLWGRHRLRLELLSENLDSGQSLSNSLERQPGLVPLSVIVRLRLGEETGTLSDVLPACGAGQLQNYAKAADLIATQNAFTILLLPVLLLPLITCFLGYFIIPKHKRMYEDFGIQQSELSLFIFNLLDFKLGFPTILGLISACFVTCVGIVLMRDPERDWPFLSRLAPRSNAPLILRSLAILVRESRPLSTGLRALASSHPRLTVRAQLKQVLSQIDHGADAWEALANQGLISPHDLMLLHAAERLRNLPWALDQIAATIELRSRNRLQIALELVAPIISITIGLAVLALVMSLSAPYVLMLDNTAKLQ